MTNHLRNVLLRTTAVVSLIVAGTAAASAQTNINGGGSTLATPVYQAQFADYVHSAYKYNYCPSGSGAAQTAFLNNQITAFGASCTLTGNVDFGASDATLTTTQINAFLAANPGHPLIQIPTFGTPITLPFNLAGRTSNGSVNLTDDQVCGVFSGKITDWHAIDATIAAGTGIQVVYRSDKSGTSFLTTQHLGAVCNTTNSNFFNAGYPNAGKTSFGGTTSFASLFPSSTPPSNFIGANGSGGIQSTVTSTANAIGYVGPDYTQIATVNFGNTAFPVVAKVNSTLPNTANTSAALGTAPRPTNKADQTQWVPAVPNPATGYKIVGYTTWDLASCYADHNVGAGLVQFLNNLYNATNVSPGPTLVNEIKNRGFVPVTGSTSTAAVAPNTLASDIVTTFLSNNGGLSINTTVNCAGGR